MQKSHAGNRLVWIDAAKAIAIIAMILGHEIGDGNNLHFWIYSFHMPIFFILSGYTSHLVISWTDWRKQVKKLVIRVLALAILMVILYQVERALFSEGDWSRVLPLSVKETFWGADPMASMYSGGLSVEIEWFLFLYFFAKLFYDWCSIIFKDKDYGIVLALLAFACYQFISIHIHLPFVMDLVPLASFYMYIGHLIRVKKAWLGQHYYYVVGGAFVFWGIMLINHQCIDMATRDFTNNYILGVLETIAGSFVVMICCQSIEDFNLVSKLSLLGKHTLMLMFIHELDCYNFTGKYVIKALHLNNYTSGIYRVVVDILIMFIVLALVNFVKAQHTNLKRIINE